MNIQDTLDERGKQYGEFESHAEISQALKEVIYQSHGRGLLSDDKREALEMIMHKVARIINGNPEFIDSWRDICGYSQLIVNNLTKDAK